MTWIKICGITNVEDAQAAVEAGADALGFVFYGKSPRKVDPETAQKIVAELPAHVEKVGVFVDEPAQRIADVADSAGLTAVQLHISGNRRLEKQVTSKKVFLALSANQVSFPADRTDPAWESFFALPENLAAIFAGSGTAEQPGGTGVSYDSDESSALVSVMSEQYSAVPAGGVNPAAIFVDSGTSHQPGGTGRPFDWEEASAFVSVLSKQYPIVVAGGLTPANVAEAMHILKPWGVDVSSGVEAGPGRKDPEKVRAFVKAVREADGKAG